MLRREKLLDGVHPDLVRVVRRAADLVEGLDLVVLEGVRSLERQKQLAASGASKVVALGRHLRHPDGWAYAVDLGAWLPVVDADGDGKDDDGVSGLRWEWVFYPRIAAAMQQAGQELQVPIRWGGDWNGNGRSDDERLLDGPHFELPRASYPGTGKKVA